MAYFGNSLLSVVIILSSMFVTVGVMYGFPVANFTNGYY